MVFADEGESTSGVAVMPLSLTTAVIYVAPGLTRVKFGGQRRDTHHRGAQKHRSDGVGEVVVGDPLTEHREQAEDGGDNHGPPCGARHQNDHAHHDDGHG